MKDLLEGWAKALATQGDQVEVRETDTQAVRLFEVDVAEEDFSAVAGPKAACWSAMQTLAAHAAHAAGDARRVRVEIVTH